MKIDLTTVSYLSDKQPSKLNKREEAVQLCTQLGYDFVDQSGSTIQYMCTVHGVRTTNLQALRRGSGCVLCHKGKESPVSSVETGSKNASVLQQMLFPPKPVKPRRGDKPGGAKKPWEHYKALCEPHLPDGITLLGYVEPYNGSRSKLRLVCATHGEWTSTRVRTVIDLKGISCPACRKQATQLKWEDVKEVIEKPTSWGMTFVKVLGEWEGGKTRLRYNCPEHGDWDTARVTSVLSSGTNCPRCVGERNKVNCLQDDSYHIANFMALGRYPVGTIFTRLAPKGSQQRWNMWCPVCAEDEFSKAGIGDGNFICAQSNLKTGNVSCRCTGVPRYTEEQWLYRIEKACKRRDYTFLKIKGKGAYSHRTVVYLCPEHGEQEIMTQSLTLGYGCASCAGQVQKEAYINVILDGETPVGLKFGISGNSDSRLYQQNSTNMFQMEQMGVWIFEETAICRSAEKECLSVLDCGIMTRTELKDGWTETTSTANYDKIVEIYERFGGTKK